MTWRWRSESSLHPTSSRRRRWSARPSSVSWHSTARCRPVAGAMALVAAARGAGLSEAVVPLENAGECAAVAGVTVRPAETLRRVARHLAGVEAIARAQPPPATFSRTDARDDAPDLASVVGQAVGRRALEVAVAGRHNLAFIGPPGVGKTLLARAASGLLPPLDEEEAVEVSRIHSVAGTVDRRAPLSHRRPFRMPHHTISPQALVGGGPRARPGEASLAHRGALFLDEALQFRVDALDALRGPLDSGAVHIARVGGVLLLPARFMLIAAFNPCPCGWFGIAGHECRCDDGARRRYQSRLSGPMRDRLDLVVPLEPVAIASAYRNASEPTARVARRVAMAARAQSARQGVPNAELEPGALGPRAGFDARIIDLLHARGHQMGLSLRRLHRAARVARTIADLDKADRVGAEHLDEALQHRAPRGRRMIGVGVPEPERGAPSRASERDCWIALSLLPGIGPAGFAKLVRRHGSATAAWRAGPQGLSSDGGDAAAAAGFAELAEAGPRVVARQLEQRTRASGGRVVTDLDDDYPVALRTLDPRPPVLHVAGDPVAFDERAVAIVGTRRASGYGLATASELADDLAAAGVVVVSGLALGIDGAAHRAAIAAGGRSVAVLPSPLDRIYPPGHRGLARDLVRGGGALVTEVPVGVAIGRPDFARRNRLIAGLAEAVIVVEAPDRSGALLTAAAAIATGRELYAVPGPIDAMASRGGNRLIADHDAVMVTSSASVLRQVGLAHGRRPPAVSSLSEVEGQVLRRLLERSGSIEELVDRTGHPPASVASALTLLEARGLVSPFGGATFHPTLAAKRLAGPV